MRFYEVLTQIIGILVLEQRVSYQALKRRFDLDDAYLADIQAELIEVHRLAAELVGKMLVWTGGRSPSLIGSPARHTALDDLEVAPSAADSQPPPLLPTAVSHSASIVTAEAERRQLTVLFCDLVGSTQLSGQLDPEDLRAVVRVYQAAAAAVIQPYAGHIAQYLGDGLLVYFGYPTAHEDDARRAVHTGLGIVQAIATLNSRLAVQYSVQLAVRLGIHTGPVVVGQMGSGGRHEHLALGETPNLAARLQGLAPANAVVISAVTARLVQGTFALEALGTHALQGVTEPMTVSRVRSLLAPPSHDEEFVTAGVPFLVGREEESGLLRRRWEQSKAGLGQVVFISGEAGIGKSALVEGLRAQVRAEGLPRIAYRCSPYHTISALYPVITHIQHLLWFWLGALSAARQHLEACIALYTPDQRRAPVFRIGHDLGVACRTFTAATLWLLGYPEQALARVHEALALAHELSHPYSLGWAQCWAAWVSQFRRDVLAVHEHAEAAVALSTAQGFPLWTAWGTSLRGWALAMQGQSEEGMAQGRQGIVAWRATGAAGTVPYYCTVLAEVSDRFGHPEDGWQALAEAHSVVEQHEERWWEAEVHRLRGVLLLNAECGVRGAELTAEEYFQQALAIAHRQEAKSLELRAAMSLACLWQQQGKRQEAHDLLAPIYGWFTEGFDTADLQEARVLLEQLSGERGQVGAGD